MAAWRDTVVANAVVLNLTINKMEQNKDKIPTQLVNLVTNISMISSDIDSLKANHRANLRLVVQQASGLIVVLGRLYLKSKYPGLWPPPPLNRAVHELVKIIENIGKLLVRKCEKSFLKRKIFLVLDLGKVKKILRMLNLAAENIEKGESRHVVDINAELLEAVNKYGNTQDEEAQLLEVEVERFTDVKTGAKMINPEPVVQGFRQQEAEKSSLTEIVKQKVKSEAIEEDDQVGYKSFASQERNGNGNEYPKEMMAQRNPKAEKDLKRIWPSEEEDVEHEENVMKPRYEDDKDREDLEGSSRQVPTTNAQIKRKNENQGYEMEDVADVPLGRPGNPRKGNSRKAQTRTSTRAARETLTSQSSPPSPQRGMSFNNTGPGIMINRDIGNSYGATISNVGNDNSVKNYYTIGRRRRS